MSQLLGLRWGDIDFDNLTVRIQRSFVEGEIYSTKTEASESPLPLDANLANVLLAHKAKATCPSDSHYVFAGESGKPRWPHSMLADHIKPAAVKAGIGKTPPKAGGDSSAKRSILS